jgi:hypothetical protein
MSNKRVKSLDYDDNYYDDDYDSDGGYDYDGQPEGNGYGPSYVTAQVPQRLSAEDEKMMQELTPLVKEEVDKQYNAVVPIKWIREALWQSYWDVQGAVDFLKGGVDCILRG